MPESDLRCPICEDAPAQSGNSVGRLRFRCTRCGLYELEFRFLAGIARIRQDPEFLRVLPYLSAHLRQASERGEVVEVRHDNWKLLAEGHAHTSVSRKLDMLLRLCCTRSVTAGKTVVLDADDFVLLDAADAGEMVYLINALVEQQFLALRGSEAAGLYLVTPKGWERFSPNDPGGVPGTCFVAMAFDESLDEVYDTGIEPAVRACGLAVVRVDRVQHNGVVTDLIQAEIRRAQLIVADVTLQRQGVYFEAGLALGLGRTVIWSCREDEIKKVHFDTRQYSHVLWNNAAELRARLEARIRSTVPIPVKF